MNGIIVFVKNPELGKVKTRLASTMGDDKALEIYNKLVGYTQEVILQLSDAKKFVFYSTFIDKSDGWNNSHFEKRMQSNGGLGDRMALALKSALEECKSIIIVGSDCPQLNTSHIQDAFTQLMSHDIVIGPSNDGGYYLLGMNKFHPSLFEDINWSTSSVFQETLDQANKKKLSIAKLETLSDIDFEEDWIKYGF